MSTGGEGTKQESLENFEKDYLTRLEKEKKSLDLQNFIFKMTEQAKVHVTKDYIGFCEFCSMGVAREEMTYQNNMLFHKNCFQQQGKNFPPVNKDLDLKQSLAKIELVQLKNLKIRQTGGSRINNPGPKSKRKKPKRKTKKKRKAKRRPSKRRTSRRRPAGKRRTARKSRRKVKRGSKTRRKVRRSSSRKRRTPTKSRRRTSTRRKKARRRR